MSEVFLKLYLCFIQAFIKDSVSDGCSAVQSQNSLVIQRTIHIGRLGGLCYLWAVQLWMG